jgi:hypothetical protein
VYIRESQEDHLNALTENSTGIDQELLLSVFESWLKWVTKHEGKYNTK